MNIILIVVRYYGGTKLGKSGLMDAYRTTAQQTIQFARLKKLLQTTVYQLKYDYSEQALIDKWKNRLPWIELEASYRETVELTVACPKEQRNTFEKSIKSMKHKLIAFEKIKNSFLIKN